MKFARLFKNGQSQAVRLPKEFRFEGTEVVIVRRGKAVILLPTNDFWNPLSEVLGEFSEDFMSKRVQGNFEREDLKL